MILMGIAASDMDCIMADNTGTLLIGYCKENSNWTDISKRFSCHLVSTDNDISWYPSEYNWEYKTTINCLTVAPDKTIWIGIYGNSGSSNSPYFRSVIYRYDGTSVSKLITFSGLVTEIKFDIAGNSWIGVNSTDNFGGVIKNLNLEYTASNSGLPDDHVLSVAPAPDGSLWINTISGSAVMANPPTLWELRVMKPLPFHSL